MFNIGGGEILALMVIGMILIGPDKLPNIAADAAPKIIPPLDTKELIAFPLCNPCSGKTAGMMPANAGQKIPHKIPK